MAGPDVGDWGGPVPAPPAQTTPEQATGQPAAAPATTPPSGSPAAPNTPPGGSGGPDAAVQADQARAISDLQQASTDLQARVQKLESAAATAPAPAAGGGAEEQSAVDVWRQKAQQQAQDQGQPQAREMMGAEPADPATMHAQFTGTQDPGLSQVDARPLGGQLAVPTRAS